MAIRNQKAVLYITNLRFDPFGQITALVMTMYRSSELLAFHQLVMSLNDIHVDAEVTLLPISHTRIHIFLQLRGNVTRAILQGEGRAYPPFGVTLHS